MTKPYADTAACLGDTYMAMGDPAGARIWLERAATLGHLRAMTALGSLLWESREFDRAVAWLRPAAESGEPDAMFYLGLILDEQGQTGESGMWLERAASSGTAHAMGRYAIFLAEQGNFQGAREWGVKAHGAGDPYIGALLAEWGDTQPSATPRADPGDLQDERRPDQIAWTPLAHACGCVTDWGWDAAHADPFAFIQWCATIIENPCPWHASDATQASGSRSSMIVAGHPDGGPVFYARQSGGADVDLGRHLTRELNKIRQSIINGDTGAILAEIPPGYRNWMASKGYDPVDTWIQQRLTDLILNRGLSVPP